MTRLADFYITAQVARRFGVSDETVRRWCREGRFSGAQRTGRDWLVPRSALVGFHRPAMGRPRKPRPGPILKAPNST